MKHTQKNGKEVRLKVSGGSGGLSENSSIDQDKFRGQKCDLLFFLETNFSQPKIDSFTKINGPTDSCKRFMSTNNSSFLSSKQ